MAGSKPCTFMHVVVSLPAVSTITTAGCTAMAV